MSENAAPPEGETAPVAEQPAPSSKPVQESSSQISKLLEVEARIQQAREAQKQEAQEIKELDQLRQLRDLPPLEQARALGIKLPELQKAMVDDYDPTNGLKSEVNALKEKLAKRDAEERAAQELADIEDRKGVVRTYVEKNGEKFPLIQKLGFHDTVYEKMHLSTQAGKTLSEEQAASEVEESLSNLVEAALTLEKFKKEAEPAPSEPENIFASLTNKTSSEIATPRKTDHSEEIDRISAFASLLKG